MAALKIVLIMVEVICSILLIVVILLQRAKGEGLGLAFGAEMGESIFGARASSALVKITVWLGTIFIVNTIILATIYSHASSSRSLLGSRPPPPVTQRGQMPSGASQLPASSQTPELPVTPQSAIPEAQPAQ